MAAEIYAARKAYREVPASDCWHTGSKIEGAGSRTHAQRSRMPITVSLADRRLENLIDDRNVPQKYVWRAEIVLFTADGAGTNEIMRRTCKSKTCVWRWQERFLEEGFEGLLRDKTRPSRIKPLDGEAAERVVALTLGDPPGETTHWTGVLMAKASGLSVSSVQRDLARPWSPTPPGSPVQAFERAANSAAASRNWQAGKAAISSRPRSPIPPGAKRPIGKSARSLTRIGSQQTSYRACP